MQQILITLTLHRHKISVHSSNSSPSEIDDSSIAEPQVPHHDFVPPLTPVPETENVLNECRLFESS